MQAENKNLLTIKDLELEFYISKTKQAKLRMRKYRDKTTSLPFIKIGGQILYRRSEIEAWLDKNSFNQITKEDKCNQDPTVGCSN